MFIAQKSASLDHLKEREAQDTGTFLSSVWNMHENDLIAMYTIIF